jgi:hypothetical protein
MQSNSKIERLTLAKAIIKYSQKTKEGKEFGIRKAFDILIDDIPYPVYSIEGYNHPNGEWNGTPTNWWLDYSDYEPSEYHRNGNIRELIPFVDKGVNRICWEINFKQKNRVKYKWDEYDIRRSGHCVIKANGREIYQFSTFDVSYALAKAQYLMINLLEHPFNFLKPEEESGRKIWYYGLPAIVEPSSFYPGEIKVKPDYTEIEEKKWWDLYWERSQPVLSPETKDDTEDFSRNQERFEETKDCGSINHGDVLWDGMINWFRK